jgi:hypothetical protein
MEGNKMLCKKCGNPLIVAKSRLELVNDNMPDIPTEAYTCLDMVCICTTCSNYAGEDLSNPLTIAEVVKHNQNIDVSMTKVPVIEESIIEPPIPEPIIPEEGEL